MRTVYKVLAYAVAAEVVVQAMAIVFGVAGLVRWVNDGGVFDKAVFESEGSPFPEVVGFVIHGINGMMIIPLVALLLLISSFFAKIPGGAKWAGLVLLLVIVQVNLGFLGTVIPAAGALHGLNALMLFSAAVYTARRTRTVSVSPAIDPAATPDVEPTARATTPA
jgi:hypothetical protein